MFTGIIEEVGTISRIVSGAEGARLTVRAHAVLADTRVGDSIAVSGPCLTVVELGPQSFVADCMAETLRSSTLGQARPGTRVNLERALSHGGRMGGHMVLGHVDAVGSVVTVQKRGIAREVWLSLPGELHGLVAPKGSVAVDGISLTVIAVEERRFSVGIIPHTWESTTMGETEVGRSVNLEADVIARYVRQALTAVSRGGTAEGREAADDSSATPSGGLSEETLRTYGFA